MVEVFLGADEGLTAEQVMERMPDVDQATVYRTLVQFEQVGIVEHVHLGHRAATYRLAGSGGVPVVCDVCGRTIEIAPRELDGLVALVRRRHRMVIDVGHFALTGRCTTCSNEV
jgi:Fur family ferric uptake transcriptional regulator